MAADYIKGIKNAVDSKVKIYPGLFEPFTAGTPSDLLYQIKHQLEGANGVVLFDKAHLSNEFIHALKARAFNKTENSK